MKKLKGFTQSITWLLVLTMAALCGWLIGGEFTATGATAAIDSLHEVSPVWFWFALLFSRWAFVALSFIVIWPITTWLHRSGWFYFKPFQESIFGYSSHGEKSKDQSGQAFLWAMLVALLLTISFLVGDLSIRGNLRDPFFLEERMEQVEELPSGNSSFYFSKK